MSSSNHEADVYAVPAEDNPVIAPGLEEGASAIVEFEERVGSLDETTAGEGGKLRPPLTNGQNRRRHEIVDFYKGASSVQLRRLRIRALVALNAIKATPHNSPDNGVKSH